MGVEDVVADFNGQPARLHEDAVAVAECVGVVHGQTGLDVVSEAVCIGDVEVGCAVEDCLHESGRDVRVNFHCHQALV